MPIKSFNKMSGIFVIITILQPNSVVWCRPIPIAEPVRTSKTQIMERCNVNAKDNHERRENDAVKMAYPPDGTGLFRDPLEVLGPLFPTKRSINTCEMHMTLTADTASNVRFTGRGEDVCTAVCKQYKTNMITDGPVDVTLLKGYCEYSNTMESLEQIDLATECTCVYRVQCQSKSSVIMYSFQANAVGFMKVTMSEADKLKPIT